MKAIHLSAYGNPAQSLRMVEVSEPNPYLRAKLWCAQSVHPLEFLSCGKG